MRQMTTAFVAVLALFAFPSRPGAGAQSEGPDPVNWEEFIDGVMAAQQQAHHFAGAVVVVVSDGQVAFKKGYGYADFAERKPVDPARTLFRVASNSKMFLWTAVMQLVEEGKVDLHTSRIEFSRRCR
jgi:CubicO group peptidase (beta-lactamase class C family)